MIEHLLKLQASPAEQPERGWRESVRRARHEIDKLLRASPSLRRELGAMIADETAAARALVRDALADDGEQPLIDLDQLSYTEAQVLGDWMPPRR